MATITDTTTDANGNIIINVSSSADDAITLATAGTYSDKNIIFNITIDPDFGDKETLVASTMTAAGWNSATKKYSFELIYPKASYNISVSPANTCTQAQIEAWNDAMITGDAENNIATALGILPTVDIPVIIRVVKK